MEISLLRYFLTVARTQSIRESATLVGISAAGLSKGIKSLEHRLGKTLIEAEGRGIRLTRAGEELAQQLAPQLDALEATLFGQGPTTKGKRPLRVATFEVFSTHIMTSLMAENVSLPVAELLEAVPGAIETAIDERRADLGITLNPSPNANLSYLKVATFASRIFVGARSKLQDTPVHELPFVVPFPPNQGSASRAIGLDGWPAEKPREIKYRVTMMESALSLCANGVAAGFFAEPVVVLYNANLVGARKLIPHLSRITGAEQIDVFVVTRKGDEDLPVVRTLAKELRRVAKLRVD
ncbi:MAG TPA: LysR family transcriptional regulator [Bdellovibrionota bacterium]|jgi:DNA-binding transcriptional LysR family regulator|nr:LysR family transcriptional regulator [Bdellovibrionota bacterium]